MTDFVGVLFRRAAFVFAILSACFFLAHVASAAATEPLDPAADIPIGQLPAACQAGTSEECENAVIYYLDKARTSMGLGPYLLPLDFPMLSPDRQTFVLTNLDRIAYGVEPIPGLNADLNIEAENGVRKAYDVGTPANGYPWEGLASNWAGGYGYENALEAYYVWLYADAEEAWGHRHNIFYWWTFGTPFAMGASAGVASESNYWKNQPSYAMVIAGSQQLGQPAPPYYYTWAEAVADGAGSYAYDPGVPRLPSAKPNAKDSVRPTHLSIVRRKGVLRVRAGAELIGRLAEMSTRREVVPCALRLAARRCTWVLSTPVRRRRIRLTGRSKLRVRPPGRWERVAVQLRTKPFTHGSDRFAATRASVLLFGPKPHGSAR